MLTHGLGTEMPSVDDVDDTKDGISDARVHDTDDRTELHLNADEPLYDSDSEAEEANFAAGLSFDDDTASKVNSDALLGGILSQGQSTVLAAMSSSAVSSLMTSAATGLTAIRHVVSRVQQSRRTDDAASDSDIIDAEFEFLNDDEFNRSDNCT